MRQAANVQSLESIQDFRVALIKFIEQGSESMVAWRMETRKCVDYFQSDLPAYWKQQVNIGWTKVAEARVDLELARTRKLDGQAHGCEDEIKALDKAKRKVRKAEEMVEVTRRWSQKIQEEIHDHEGRMTHLETYFESNLNRAVADLEYLTDTLHKYISVEGSMQAVPTETKDKSK